MIRLASQISQLLLFIQIAPQYGQLAMTPSSGASLHNSHFQHFSSFIFITCGGSAFSVDALGDRPSNS